MSLQAASVGLSKKLYQVLYPMEGVRPSPLSKARVEAMLEAKRTRARAVQYQASCMEAAQT